MGQKPGKVGDILQNLIQKEGRGGKTLEDVQRARRVLREFLGPQISDFAYVAAVRAGLVEILVETPALFQEIRGFRQGALLEALRGAGLKVRGIKVKVGQRGEAPGAAPSRRPKAPGS